MMEIMSEEDFILFCISDVLSVQKEKLNAMNYFLDNFDLILRCAERADNVIESLENELLIKLNDFYDEIIKKYDERTNLRLREYEHLGFI